MYNEDKHYANQPIECLLKNNSTIIHYFIKFKKWDAITLTQNKVLVGLIHVVRKID